MEIKVILQRGGGIFFYSSSFSICLWVFYGAQPKVHLSGHAWFSFRYGRLDNWCRISTRTEDKGQRSAWGKPISNPGPLLCEILADECQGDGPSAAFVLLFLVTVSTASTQELPLYITVSLCLIDLATASSGTIQIKLEIDLLLLKSN